MGADECATYRGCIVLPINDRRRTYLAHSSDLRDALSKLESLAPSDKPSALNKIVGPVKNLITAHTVDSALVDIEKQIKTCLAELSVRRAVLFVSTQQVNDGSCAGYPSSSQRYRLGRPQGCH
jgi:hypothetical protein